MKIEIFILLMCGIVAAVLTTNPELDDGKDTQKQQKMFKETNKNISITDNEISNQNVDGIIEEKEGEGGKGQEDNQIKETEEKEADKDDNKVEERLNKTSLNAKTSEIISTIEDDEVNHSETSMKDEKTSMKDEETSMKDEEMSLEDFDSSKDEVLNSSFDQDDDQINLRMEGRGRVGGEGWKQWVNRPKSFKWLGDLPRKASEWLSNQENRTSFWHQFPNSYKKSWIQERSGDTQAETPKKMFHPLRSLLPKEFHKKPRWRVEQPPQAAERRSSSGSINTKPRKWRRKYGRRRSWAEVNSINPQPTRVNQASLQSSFLEPLNKLVNKHQRLKSIGATNIKQSVNNPNIPSLQGSFSNSANAVSLRPQKIIRQTMRPNQQNKDTEFTNLVYYASLPDSTLGSNEHHLAIIEVPKNAHGKIPLNSVHVMAPTLTQTGIAMTRNYNEWNNRKEAPYVMTNLNNDSTMKEDPFLVIPYKPKVNDPKYSEIKNIVLPLRQVSNKFNHMKNHITQTASNSYNINSQYASPSSNSYQDSNFGSHTNNNNKFNNQESFSQSNQRNPKVQQQTQFSGQSTNQNTIEEPERIVNNVRINGYGPPKASSIVNMSPNDVLKTSKIPDMMMLPPPSYNKPLQEYKPQQDYKPQQEYKPQQNYKPQQDNKPQQGYKANQVQIQEQTPKKRPYKIKPPLGMMMPPPPMAKVKKVNWPNVYTSTAAPSTSLKAENMIPSKPTQQTYKKRPQNFNKYNFNRKPSPHAFQKRPTGSHSSPQLVYIDPPNNIDSEKQPLGMLENAWSRIETSLQEVPEIASEMLKKLPNPIIILEKSREKITETVKKGKEVIPVWWNGVMGSIVPTINPAMMNFIPASFLLDDNDDQEVAGSSQIPVQTLTTGERDYNKPLLRKQKKKHWKNQRPMPQWLAGHSNKKRPTQSTSYSQVNVQSVNGDGKLKMSTPLVRTPGVHVINDVMRPPITAVNYNSNEILKEDQLPPPSHRGSPAVGLSLTNPKGGPFLNIAKDNILQPLNSNNFISIDPQTNPASNIKHGLKSYNGPRLIMFSLDDAIPLVPANPWEVRNKDPMMSTASEQYFTTAHHKDDVNKKQFYKIKFANSDNHKRARNIVNNFHKVKSPLHSNHKEQLRNEDLSHYDQTHQAAGSSHHPEIYTEPLLPSEIQHDDESHSQVQAHNIKPTAKPKAIRVPHQSVFRNTAQSSVQRPTPRPYLQQNKGTYRNFNNNQRKNPQQTAQKTEKFAPFNFNFTQSLQNRHRQKTDSNMWTSKTQNVQHKRKNLQQESTDRIYATRPFLPTFPPLRVAASRVKSSNNRPQTSIDYHKEDVLKEVEHESQPEPNNSHNVAVDSTEVHHNVHPYLKEEISYKQTRLLNRPSNPTQIKTFSKIPKQRYQPQFLLPQTNNKDNIPTPTKQNILKTEYTPSWQSIQTVKRRPVNNNELTRQASTGNYQTAQAFKYDNKNQQTRQIGSYQRTQAAPNNPNIKQQTSQASAPDYERSQALNDPKIKNQQQTNKVFAPNYQGGQALNNYDSKRQQRLKVSTDSYQPFQAPKYPDSRRQPTRQVASYQRNQAAPNDPNINQQTNQPSTPDYVRLQAPNDQKTKKQQTQQVTSSGFHRTQAPNNPNNIKQPTSQVSTEGYQSWQAPKYPGSKRQQTNQVSTNSYQPFQAPKYPDNKRQQTRQLTSSGYQKLQAPNNSNNIKQQTSQASTDSYTPFQAPKYLESKRQQIQPISTDSFQSLQAPKYPNSRRQQTGRYELPDYPESQKQETRQISTDNYETAPSTHIESNVKYNQNNEQNVYFQKTSPNHQNTQPRLASRPRKRKIQPIITEAKLESNYVWVNKTQKEKATRTNPFKFNFAPPTQGDNSRSRPKSQNSKPLNQNLKPLNQNLKPLKSSWGSANRKPVEKMEAIEVFNEEDYEEKEDTEDPMETSFSEQSEVKWPKLIRQRGRRYESMKSNGPIQITQSENQERPQTETTKEPEPVSLTPDDQNQSKRSPFNRIRKFRNQNNQKFKRPHGRTTTTAIPSNVPETTTPSLILPTTTKTFKTATIETATTKTATIKTTTISTPKKKFDFMSRFRNRKKHSIRHPPPSLVVTPDSANDLATEEIPLKTSTSAPNRPTSKVFKFQREISNNNEDLSRTPGRNPRIPVESVLLQDSTPKPFFKNWEMAKAPIDSVVDNKESIPKEENKRDFEPSFSFSRLPQHKMIEDFEKSISLPTSAAAASIDLDDKPQVSNYQRSPFHLNLPTSFNVDLRDTSSSFRRNDIQEEFLPDEGDIDNVNTYVKSPSYSNIKFISGRSY